MCLSLRGRLDVDLDQLGEVDVIAEGVLDGVEVGAVPIGRQLDAARDAGLEVGHDHAGRRGRPIAHEPGDEELGVGIDGEPRPGVPGLGRGGLGLRDVALLGVAEGPDLVGLYARRCYVPYLLIVYAEAGTTGVAQQAIQFSWPGSQRASRH